MKSIVTGAAGFIGSYLIKRIGIDKVICCDLIDDGMLSPKECIKLLNDSQDEIECVFHLGAISSTTENNIAKLAKENMWFSCELLELCIKQKIPFVYASSASVYGFGKNGFWEDAVLTPLNYYAISKAFFDLVVVEKIKENLDSKIVGLRYFNVYGANEDHKKNMASPVYKFLKQAKRTGEIKIFEGSENFMRDFIYIDDVVSITINAMNFLSGIYNVGTGKERSFLKVAQIISELIEAKIIKVPFPKKLIGKYQEFTCSENEKIDFVGYPTHRISLEDGIRKTINDIWKENSIYEWLF